MAKIRGHLAKYGGCSVHAQSPACDWLMRVPTQVPGPAGSSSASAHTVHCTARLLQVQAEVLRYRAPIAPCFHRCLGTLKPRVSACSESRKRCRTVDAQHHNEFGFSHLSPTRLSSFRRAVFGSKDSWSVLGGPPNTAARRVAWRAAWRKSSYRSEQESVSQPACQPPRKLLPSHTLLYVLERAQNKAGRAVFGGSVEAVFFGVEGFLIRYSTLILHHHINFGSRVLLELFHSVPHLV